MATGQTSAGGGGEAEVVFGTLTESDINVTSSSITITFPSAIKQLCGLVLLVAEEIPSIRGWAFLYPGINMEGEVDESYVTTLRPLVAGSNQDLGRSFRPFIISGNSLIIQDGLDDYQLFGSGAYTYIPE